MPGLRCLVSCLGELALRFIPMRIRMRVPRPDCCCTCRLRSDVPHKRAFSSLQLCASQLEAQLLEHLQFYTQSAQVKPAPDRMLHRPAMCCSRDGFESAVLVLRAARSMAHGYNLACWQERERCAWPRATVQAYNEEGQSNGDEALPVGY